MPQTSTIHPSDVVSPPSAAHTLHTIHTTLKVLFGLVPIVAGLDKFTNLLANWAVYLNPIALDIVPLTAHQFMQVVGVIEIVAGILVFAKPRLGGYVVMAWLIAIALQLIFWGQYLDIAVRDLTIAIGGALTLARLTPIANGHATNGRS